ncbi:MAG TPA: CARDB domain-containing protein, partial [Polyangiaceae bacterium]|nr:CARDB domain-containing protein [Polyangiaceae bacterium]
LELPDITTVGIPGFKCLQSQAMANVSVQMCNRGLKTVPIGQGNVALVAADNPQNVLCTKTNATELASGKCENVSCTVPVPSQNAGFDILIMGDPSNSIPECDDSNNTSLISNVYCIVTH